MCSKEEVQEVVNKAISESEKRIESRFVEHEKKYDEYLAKLQLSHTTVAGTISNFGGEFDKIHRKLDKYAENTNKDIGILNLWKATHTIEYNNMAQTLDNITSGISRITWMVLTALITAVLSLILI